MMQHLFGRKYWLSEVPTFLRQTCKLLVRNKHCFDMWSDTVLDTTVEDNLMLYLTKLVICRLLLRYFMLLVGWARMEIVSTVKCNSLLYEILLFDYTAAAVAVDIFVWNWPEYHLHCACSMLRAEQQHNKREGGLQLLPRGCDAFLWLFDLHVHHLRKGLWTETRVNCSWNELANIQS